MKLILLLLLVPLASGTPCRDYQYWSKQLGQCVACTRCRQNQITTRPCQPHADTVCSALKDAQIDWPWMKKKSHHGFDDQKLAEHRHHEGQTEINTSNEEKHKDFKHHHKKKAKDKFADQFFEVKHDEPTLRPQRLNSKRLKHFDNDDFDDDQTLKSKHNKKEDKKRKSSVPYEGLWKSSDGKTLPIGIRDEEKLRNWLKQSEKKLKHRKDDLLKNLKEEHLSEDDDENRVKLNHPLRQLDPQLIQGLLNHESHSNKTRNHQTSISEMEILKSLTMEKEELEPDVLNLISKSNDRSAEGNSIRQSKHLSSSLTPGKVHEKFSQFPSEGPIEAIPFTTAERLVSDWQIVAFVSAIASCLLFFVVAIIYTLLNAHQWRRVKIRYEVDPDEMSSKLALMQPSMDTSASDGIPTGRYLEHLIALHQLEGRKTNEYTNDKQSS